MKQAKKQGPVPKNNAKTTEVAAAGKRVPWEVKYNELVNYKHSTGHYCIVERTHPSLGRWVNTQRTEYKKWKEGKKSNLTQNRIDKLNEGISWMGYQVPL